MQATAADVARGYFAYTYPLNMARDVIVSFMKAGSNVRSNCYVSLNIIGLNDVYDSIHVGIQDVNGGHIWRGQLRMRAKGLNFQLWDSELTDGDAIQVSFIIDESVT